MNVGEIRAELILMLGNVLKQTGHPFVAPTDLTYRWITRAANKIPRLAARGGGDILQTFPELRGRWQGQTAEGVPWIDRPAEALIIRDIFSFDKTGAVPDVDDERLIYQEKDINIFNLSGRTTAASPGWPTAWAMVGNRIHFKPQPRAPYLTDVHEYGIKREVGVFNNDAQTPKIGEDWHEALLFEAAAIGATEMGYSDRAKTYRAEVMMLIGTGQDVAAQEDIFDDPTFELGDLPTQSEVYE